jgi:hypothetical protein
MKEMCRMNEMNAKCARDEGKKKTTLNRRGRDEEGESGATRKGDGSDKQDQRATATVAKLMSANIPNGAVRNK